ECFARGDWWSIARLFDPEIEFRFETAWTDLGSSSGDLPLQEQGVAHGLDELAAVWLQVLEPWERFWMEGHEFIEVGDSIVVVATQRGQLKGTDRVMDRPCVDVWTFRDGRIVSHDAYLDREEALRAASYASSS